MWKKRKRLLLLCIGLGFVALNVVAFNHAWKFTHFAPADSIRTSDPEDLGMGEKLSTLFLGITNPKPSNTVFPDRDYETVWIPARESHKMEAWWIRDTSSRGIVILFHGYAGKKSSLLPEAEAFLQLGYDCLLVDMLGHGGSPGNTTSLGVYESEDVQAAVSWAREQNLGKELLIYAFSMGAVAALRAAADSLPVDALILGCPFGSMLAAAENRFDLMGIPAFPAAHLLVFWGGVQQGFWAFGNNSIDYASRVDLPVLLMYGDQDQRVQVSEMLVIQDELKGLHHLAVFKGLAHQSYYKAQPENWMKVVQDFLNSLPDPAVGGGSGIR